MNFNNISFILHKPQLSENIGLSARAMKNFGFKNLSIIDPTPLFPNDKIIATSVGAKDIIRKTRVFQNKVSPEFGQFSKTFITHMKYQHLARQWSPSLEARSHKKLVFL